MISENLFSSGFLYVVLYDIPLVWNWNLRAWNLITMQPW